MEKPQEKIESEGEEEIDKLKKNTIKKPEIKKEKKALTEDEKMADDILDTEDLK